MAKEIRLWQPIQLSVNWKECDTSIFDDISSSWLNRRKILKDDSIEYAEFINRLKREHAIETGIVEQLYDLKKGITETFIQEGFAENLLSHGDTNVSKKTLIGHLNDHLKSVNFVFDVVKENRSITTSFIKELHQLLTRNQKYTEGRDQFGGKVKIELLKGQYKITENNPTRDDGIKILYCSPDHVASEMDNLIRFYNKNESLHPLILATWFHHAFTTIHPFQDGNGRMARLLSSLIFIKHGYFPFTVLREEAKEKYIEALEQADKGKPQNLVSYFAIVQKRNIQKALNVKGVSSTSLEEVQSIFIDKTEKWKKRKVQKHEALLVESRKKVFDYCNIILNERKDSLNNELNGNANVSIASCSFDNTEKRHYFYKQIISYAKKYDYYLNRNYPKAWFMFKIEMEEDKRYQLGISIHHYGYDDSTIAIGSFLEFKSSKADDELNTILPLDIPPHVISISENMDVKMKNIKRYLEDALTQALAQIASEM